MSPLSILERLVLVCGSAVFAGLAAHARFEADRFGRALVAATLFLLAAFDVMLWWGCC